MGFPSQQSENKLYKWRPLLTGMRIVKFKDLEPWQQKLLLKAEAVMRNAYNVTSHYYVGAAVLTKKGKVYQGTFAENASLGLTVCAEVAAILAANTAGERTFKAIAIIGAHENFTSKEPVTPCGRCRQWISEFAQLADYDIEVISANTKKDKIYVSVISELLPVAFGPKDLGINVRKFRK